MFYFLLGLFFPLVLLVAYLFFRLVGGCVYRNLSKVVARVRARRMAKNQPSFFVHEFAEGV